MLEAMVEGASGASGKGSGHGNRLSLACLKADLERAADALPIAQQATRLMFSRQHRYSVWLARWHELGSPELDDPPSLPTAVDTACWHMATYLGWQEGQAA